MTFPTFWFFGFLNYLGWPRKIGLIRQRKVVNGAVFCMAVKTAVRFAIAIGVKRPNTAIKLLADLFKWDSSQQASVEIWRSLDSSENIFAQRDISPEDIIVGPHMTLPDLTNPEDLLNDLIPWENILEKGCYIDYFHMVFCQGLVWGLSHPEEALTRDEEQRQKLHKKLPEMLAYGLDVHVPETLEEYADAIEESVNEFQEQVRPLAEAPQELLELPIIKNRIGKIEIGNDIQVKTK